MYLFLFNKKLCVNIHLCVLVIAVGNGITDQSSNPDRGSFCSLRVNTDEKCNNLYVHPPACRKCETLNLVRKPVLQKGKSDFKPVLLHAKIDLVLYTASGEESWLNAYL